MTKHNNSTDSEEEVVPKQHSNKYKKTKKIIIGVIILVILIIAGLITWLYTGEISGAKQKIFTNIPLPVAIVEASPVSSVQLFQRVKLVEQILKASGQNQPNLSSNILDQLIESEKIEILTQKNNLHVNSDEIETAYKAILAQFPGANEDELKKALQDNYGLDVRTFKEQAVRQSVLQDKLSKWFNEQESLNREPYQKARDLIKQLDEGKSFEEVANAYNQDPSSKDFAGDSGFVAFSDLLPEFQDGVKDLAINDKKIIASRYGLHIIKVLAVEEKEIGGKQEKTYNLQQIFIKPNDFLKWFSDESAKIRSFKLI